MENDKEDKYANQKLIIYLNCYVLMLVSTMHMTNDIKNSSYEKVNEKYKCFDKIWKNNNIRNFIYNYLDYLTPELKYVYITPFYESINEYLNPYNSNKRVIYYRYVKIFPEIEWKKLDI